MSSLSKLVADRSVLHPPGPAGAHAVVDDDWRRRELKARLFGKEHLPHRIGRFVVLGPLGRGAMGSVQRAYDETLDRQVAIKTMHTRSSGEDDKRALREAQALARLSHPNVVQVYDVGELEGRLFIAMELVVGQTLRKWQEAGHPWRRCLEVYLQAGRGLAAAHAAGMIHRDFKPSNCIVDAKGRVRVLDFGLARHSDDRDRVQASATTTPERLDAAACSEEGPGSSHSASGLLDQTLTRAGSVVGTVGYMAPEQLDGRALDARSDQFSFCVSLYQAVAGHPPFSTAPMANLVRMAAGEPVEPAPPPPGRRVPRWLVQALRRGLAASPNERWPSMEALLRELERPLRRRFSRRVALGSVVLGAGLVGLWPSPPEGPAPPCEGVGGESAGSWDQDARADVRGAFESTELEYAGEAWLRVGAELDAYAEGLEAAYVDACMATHVRSEQTRDDLRLRRACLGQRTSALRQTVSMLAGADAQVVEKGVALVVALPRLEPCADLEALSRVEEDPAPRDAATLRQRQELREGIEQARTLETAGKLTEGLGAVAPLAERAEALGDARLAAEARLVEGLLRTGNGEHEHAVELLEDALQWALEHGSDAIAVQTLSVLIYVVGVEQAKADAARWLGLTAQSLVDRDDPHSRAEARVLTAVGQVASVYGDHARAQAHYERALEILRRAVGEDHIALADPLDSLGSALRQQGKLDAALRQSRRALEIRIRWQGQQHPDVAHQRVNLGVVLGNLGEHQEAQRQYREALAILVDAGPAHHEKLAHLRANLGKSLALQGRFAEAEAQLRQAIEAWEVEVGPEHPRVVRVRYSLGRVLEDGGHPERAAEQYRWVLELLEGSAPGPEREAMITRVRGRLDGGAG